jgi:hypothetical protein
MMTRLRGWSVWQSSARRSYRVPSHTRHVRDASPTPHDRHALLTLAASSESMPRRQTTYSGCCSIDVDELVAPGACSAGCRRRPSTAPSLPSTSCASDCSRCRNVNRSPARACARSDRSGTLTLPRSAQMRNCTGSRQSRTMAGRASGGTLQDASRGPRAVPARWCRAAASSATVAIGVIPSSMSSHAQRGRVGRCRPAGVPSSLAGAVSPTGVVAAALAPSRNSMPCAASQSALRGCVKEGTQKGQWVVTHGLHGGPAVGDFTHTLTCLACFGWWARRRRRRSRQSVRVV